MFCCYWNSIHWNERVSHTHSHVAMECPNIQTPIPRTQSDMRTVYRCFLFEPPFRTNICGLWHREFLHSSRQHVWKILLRTFRFISFRLGFPFVPRFVCPKATIYSSLLLKLRQWQRRRQRRWRHISANCMACELTLLSETKKHKQKITKRMLL